MRRGFSLIEAAIVLGIIGLVIGGIWTAAASVNFNKKVADIFGGVIFVGDRARGLWKGQVPNSNFDWAWDNTIVPGIGTPALVNGRYCVPVDGVDGMYLYIMIHNMDPSRIEINLVGVPQKLCKAIVAKLIPVLLAKVIGDIGVGYQPGLVPCDPTNLSGWDNVYRDAWDVQSGGGIAGVCSTERSHIFLNFAM